MIETFMHGGVLYNIHRRPLEDGSGRNAVSFTRRTQQDDHASKKPAPPAHDLYGAYQRFNERLKQDHKAR